MTATSDLIESLLTMQLRKSGTFSIENAQRIIDAIRCDTMIDETIRYLIEKELLVPLLVRIPTPELARMMFASLASRVSNLLPLVRNAVHLALAQNPPMTATSSWIYIPSQIYFEICVELSRVSRELGFDFSSGPAVSPIAVSEGPFSGVGATGINPTHWPSIDLWDQWNLYRWKKGLNDTKQALKQAKDAGDWATAGKLARELDAPADQAKYVNALTGVQNNPKLQDLAEKYWREISSANGISRRLDEARVLIEQPVSTLFPHIYLKGRPSRARVMGAAARKHDLTPAIIAAFIMAEQQDQSAGEDAADYQAATHFLSHADTSIGLGQVQPSSVRNHDLFSDLLSRATFESLSHRAIATLLCSDEFNIFAVARYIRCVAKLVDGKTPENLPRTHQNFPGMDIGAYKKHGSEWPDDNIGALGSEYTSKPWDDKISYFWGALVREAHSTFKGIRFE